MAGQGDAWEGRPYKIALSRFGEYTDNAISEKYKVLDEKVISQLQALPTLFAYEQGHNVAARVGFIERVISRAGQVRIDYQLYSRLPAIPASQLAALAWELDIADYEMNRTHWAVKGVDLLPVFVEAGLITKEHLNHLPAHFVRASVLGIPAHLVVAPHVFKIPDEQTEEDLVSVMMPLDAAFTPVYEAIQRSCTVPGLRCVRADDIWRETAIVQDVFNLLVRSHIVIVDFTGRNPNVMYETGIAHTLGRLVIPISQSLDDVPFDLRHHRVLKYLPNAEGLTSMQAILTERLKTLSRRTGPSS